MFKFNKMLFIVILSLSIGFSFLPFSSVTTTAQAYGGGGGGGEKNASDDDIALGQTSQSTPSGTTVTVSEACEAINNKPQTSRDQFIDKSIQSAINFMDKNATVKPVKKKKENGLVITRQQLGAAVFELLIECPELTPKQAIKLTIFFVHLRASGFEGPLL